ncbi:uncharacterized protein LOC126742843 [Anthonomus grandis grandis]|uniref:uncharacterized protein LOC126742843 n=1 Tax=Anthonomus grandis grandis TaxID=2921223 RepID=UPI002164F271|nr:uncharacterized protein LOC126742843 [Anthonomus grandis grandis]
MSSFLGNLSTFDPEKSDYAIFSERLKQFFVANGITEDDKMRAILLNTLNEDCYVLLRNLCVPKTPPEVKFQDLDKLLLKHFAPVRSYFSERSKFYSAQREPGEKVCDWAARVKNLVSNCGFEATITLSTLMRDIFAIGINDVRFSDRLFEENAISRDCTFQFMEKIALAKESAVADHEKRVSKESQAPIKTELEEIYYNQNPGTSRQNRGKSKSKYTVKRDHQEKPALPKCSVCGRANHVFSNCAYRSCFCHKCGIKGHLAPMCKKLSGHNFLQENLLQDSSDENDEMCFNIKSNSSSYYNKLRYNSKGNERPIIIKLLTDGLQFDFEIDSGFAHAAISENFYKHYFTKYNLIRNDLSLKDYVGVSFNPLGYLNLNIIYDYNNYILKTYVIKNGGPPLIGRNGLKMLNIGLCKIDSNNNNRLLYVNSETKLQYLLKHFGQIFDGTLGTFNKFKVTLKLKENAIPRFFKPRPVPIALKPKIDEELDRLIKNKVLILTEFSKWATPIVPILKKNGGLRICGDFKVTLNPQLEFQQFPLPRIEYLFSRLEGGLKFSKIDLSEAYQQILLYENSTELVTISTHRGLFSYQRLPFGIHCAPSIFQVIMEQLFNGIPGVIAFLMIF